MTTRDSDTAKTFLRAIATADVPLAVGCIARGSFIDHSPMTSGGEAGLRAFVAGLSTEGSELRVIRVLRDGPMVVTQAEGELHGCGVFFDAFRFEDGVIAEHWAFAAKGAPPNKSGHTQADGPAETAELQATEANKATVRDYYSTVHFAGKHDQARRWFTGDLMIRHEPGVADGVSQFLSDLEVLTRDRTIDEIKLLVGQGDLVFIAARGTHKGDPCAYIDLYRVSGGRIVEHWGFPEPFPAPAEQRNDIEML